jgi:hypothetical protein
LKGIGFFNHVWFPKLSFQMYFFWRAISNLGFKMYGSVVLWMFVY